MPTIGTLVVNIHLNNAQFLTQINRTTQATQRAMTQMQKSVGSLDKAFLILRRTFLSFFALSSANRAVREVANYADAWKVASNQIAAANVISEHQARSMSGIVDIALKTRTSLAETAELYAKLLRSTNGVAQSEMEVAKATELVNKAFKAGGASIQEQVNGIRQLAQSLASGIFQGDELRSIRENAPLLAKAIADEFNTTIGGLKRLGAQGALTADRVFAAILKHSKPIEDAFAATNATIEDSFTNLGTAITEYVGNLDKALGASKSFTDFAKEMAKSLTEAARGPAFESTPARLFEESNKILELLPKVGKEFLRWAFWPFGDDIADFFAKYNAGIEEAGKKTSPFVTLLTALRQQLELAASEGAKFRLFTQANRPLPTSFPDLVPHGGRGFGLPKETQESFEKGLQAVAEWRTELQGGAGDMGKLAAAAGGGTKALDAARIKIEAYDAVLKVLKGDSDAVVNMTSAYAEGLMQVYINAKLATDANQQLAETIDATDEAQRQAGFQKLLQLAGEVGGADEVRKLQDHIELLNQATSENIDLSTAAGQAWLEMQKRGQEARSAVDAMNERLDDFSRTINSTISSSISQVSSAFADAVVEGENFRDMLDSLLKDLAKLALNAVFQYFLKQLIGGVGTTSQEGSGLMGLIPMPGAAAMHSGGMVGGGGHVMKSLPASMFATAPRFHAGLLPGEFPAVLQKGEGVFTDRQMKALSGGGNVNINIQNKNGSDVRADAEKDDQGNMNVEIIIDQVMGRKLLQPGSSSNKAMKQGFGAQPVGIRR